MVKKIFNGWSTLFLPIGGPTKVSRASVSRGGEQDFECDGEHTDFIFANRWDDVVEHFNPFPGLLEHFVEIKTHLANPEWISESVRRNEHCVGALFWLHPKSPSGS